MSDPQYDKTVHEAEGSGKKESMDAEHLNRSTTGDAESTNTDGKTDPSFSVGSRYETANSNTMEWSRQRTDAWPQLMTKYECLAPLGSGSFGAVFQVWDTELQIERAVKLSHRDVLEKGFADVDHYLDEARKLVRLDHPGIVRLIDAARTDDGLVYLVTEYMPGGTLLKRLETTRLTAQEAAQLVATLADTLAYLHKKGVVHRDVKPANILFDAEDRPRIADFGLALRDEEFGQGHRSCGTIGYMAPEQFGEAQFADGRADIYSLGVILYEMLTRRSPYRSTNLSDLEVEIQTVEPKPLRQIDPNIDRELERICQKAMAKRLQDRYGTAFDLSSDLRRFLRKPAIPRWVIAGLIALSAVVAISTAFLAWRTPTTATTAGNTAAEKDQSTSRADPTPEETPVGVMLTPNLEIHLQRANENNTYTVVESESHMPIFTNDKIQLRATSERPVYFYLFWVDDSGKPTRLWPPKDSPLDKQQRLTEIWSPTNAQSGHEAQWWPVEGSTSVHEIAMVGVSEYALTAEQLANFESRKYTV